MNNKAQKKKIKEKRRKEGEIGERNEKGRGEIIDRRGERERERGGERGKEIVKIWGTRRRGNRQKENS